MFVFISIALLILTVLVMFVLRLTRRDFGYHWLIAASGAFLAWLMILLTGINLPASLHISAWDFRSAYPNSITLAADGYSWPFAFFLGTLILATLLTDVVRAYDLDWSNWARSLLITSFGLIGVLSGNLLTFILAWTAFDLVNVVILLLQLPSGKSRRQAVFVFFSRLLGTASLLVAGVISVSDNNSFLLERTSPNAIIFIALAAGFRLISIPEDSSLRDNPIKQRSLGTVMSLVSSAMVLVFLVRVAVALDGVELSANVLLALFSLVGVVSVLSTAAWLLAGDEIEGRHAWLSGMGALVLASAMRSQPDSAVAWGLAMLFSGGLIFLASVRERVSMWTTLLGLAGITTLPFTLAWGGLLLFSPPMNLAMILYLPAIVFIVWGYARHSLQLKKEPAGLERWIKVVYPSGLLVILVIQTGFGLLYKPAISEVPFLGWILGVVICGLAFLGFYWQRRGAAIPQSLANIVNTILNFSWFYTILRTIFDYSSRFINFISSVLEGEGGILWVLLWIVLFLAVLLISLGS
jgi:hypothetical protein